MNKAKTLGLMAISLLTSLTFSCVSLQDRTLSVIEKNETETLGTVGVEFVSI